MGYDSREVAGALVFVGEQYFLGLGPGGMERMIVYPILLWEMGLGGYLVAST